MWSKPTMNGRTTEVVYTFSGTEEAELVRQNQELKTKLEQVCVVCVATGGAMFECVGGRGMYCECSWGFLGWCERAIIVKAQHI